MERKTSVLRKKIETRNERERKREREKHHLLRALGQDLKRKAMIQSKDE